MLKGSISLPCAQSDADLLTFGTRGASRNGLEANVLHPVVVTLGRVPPVGIALEPWLPRPGRTAGRPAHMAAWSSVRVTGTNQARTGLKTSQDRMAQRQRTVSNEGERKREGGREGRQEDIEAHTAMEGQR